MRFLIPIAAIVFLLEALFVPSGTDTGGRQLLLSATYFWHQQEIGIIATSTLDPKEIYSRLPKKISLSDWYLKRGEIEARLERHPFVERALVSRCNWYSLRCFNVSVRERKPAFLIPIRGVPWVVADDGVFLKALSETKERSDLDLSRLLKIRGIVPNTASPELVRGRLTYLTNAQHVIETELGAKLSEIELFPKGEIQIKPKEADYVAHFTFDGKDLSRIGKEAERLRLVIDKLGPKMKLVKEIDLAFDKMAVVRLKGADKGEAVS